MTSKKAGYHPGGSVPRLGRGPTTRRRPFNTRASTYGRSSGWRGQLDQGTGGGTSRTKTTGTLGKPITAKPKSFRQQNARTLTPRQKAIAGMKARSQAKIAAMRKRYNSLTPLQRASIAQKQRARASTYSEAMKQRQQAKTLTPKPTTGRPTGRTVYKSRTTIPTRRVAKPTTGRPARGRSALRTGRRPTGRTVYKSRTTIPTRRRRK